MKRLSALFIALALFAGNSTWSRSIQSASDEIKNLERQGLIVRERPGTWKTRGGLIISGTDPDGKSRMEHILKHMSDVKGKNKHGVFTIGSDRVIILMDRVWAGASSGKLKPSSTGGRYVYVYDVGEKTGYLGGRVGAVKGYPSLRKVRLVLEKRTPRVVTFYPI